MFISIVRSFFKREFYINKIIIIYLCLIYLLRQLNSLHFNVSSYYQIINYLNSKNNILIIIILLALLIINYSKINKFNYYIIILVTFFEYNIFDNISISAFNYINQSEVTLNTNLINGVMLIHPILLYLYYILVFYIVYILYNNLKYTNKKIFTKVIDKMLIKTAALILFSILLGSWWAEQELSWGGWWSWDFVELLALNYLILKLIFIHKSKNIDINELIKRVYLFTTVVILFIILVRFNIINSVHNFINSESTNQYQNYIVFFILLLLTNIYLKNKNKSKVVLIYTKYIQVNLYILIFSAFINILFTINITIKDYYFVSLMTVSLLYLNKNFSTKNRLNYLIYVGIALVFFLKNINMCILVFILIISTYIITYLDDFFKKKKFHLYLIILFSICTQQVYMFSIENNFTEVNTISVILKNTLNYTKNLFLYDHINGISLNSLKTNVFVCKTPIQNNDVLIEELYKSIFEKRIFFKKNSFIEIYNYNFQIFLNIDNSVLFLVFFFLITAILIFLFSKKKNIFI